ncbi:hypothetical protein EI42_06386 [Thermosporothrix hazakensis]|uniref:Uncharacterized protein n=1 Tax=Thermosporothrix hazakensis TaxID=644383 RepID=A0A326TQB8_THEHA|nr:hypothetical protein [Thermosporothrix hazakensis]PZW18056.1 hypothetical protein EI42_06386 [Thermosporothrix hazakensis]GCE50652.1 hypothetical protein KTH_55210 [Thermosporothrix hazakensis]
MWSKSSMRANVNTLQLLEAVVRGNFHAQMAFEAIVALLKHSGLPRTLSFDRDSRCEGSTSGCEAPSVLSRFLLCGRGRPAICPSQRREFNGGVKRF